MGQLFNLTNQLNDELRDLTPGTEEFVVKKTAELQQAQEQLDKARQQAKGTEEAVEESGNSLLYFVKKAAGFVGIQLGIEAVIEERDLKLRELQKGFDEKDAQEHQKNWRRSWPTRWPMTRWLRLRSRRCTPWAW